MKKIGAYEAKTHFSQLLDEVAKGSSIMITRNGNPVAVLGPVKARDSEKIQAAICRIRSRNKGRNLRGVTIRELIEEGRRY